MSSKLVRFNAARSLFVPPTIFVVRRHCIVLALCSAHIACAQLDCFLASFAGGVFGFSPQTQRFLKEDLGLPLKETPLRLMADLAQPTVVLVLLQLYRSGARNEAASERSQMSGPIFSSVVWFMLLQFAECRHSENSIQVFFFVEHDHRRFSVVYRHSLLLRLLICLRMYASL